MVFVYIFEKYANFFELSFSKYVLHYTFEKPGTQQGSSGGDWITIVQTLSFREWHISKRHFKGGTDQHTMISQLRCQQSSLLFLQPLWSKWHIGVSLVFAFRKVKKKNFTLNIYGFSFLGSKQSQRDKTWCFSNNPTWQSRHTSTPPLSPFQSCHNGVAFEMHNIISAHQPFADNKEH